MDMNLCIHFVGNNLFSADGNGGLTYGDVSSYAKGTTFETTLRVTGTKFEFSRSIKIIF